MKRFIVLLPTLLFTLTFSPNLSAQDWAPVGATWHYTLYHWNSPDMDYNIIESVKDTVFEGKSCRKLSVKNATCSGLGLTEYTYDSAGKVYFYNFNTQEFYLLYDFSKNPGESWHLIIPNWPVPDTVSYTVDSVSYLVLGQDSLKTQHVSVESNVSQLIFFDGEFTERMGFSGDLFPFLDGGCDASNNVGLRCYEDSIVGFYSTGLTQSCDYTTVGLEESISEKQQLEIFPNPANQQIKLVYRGETIINADVMLYSSDGECIQKLTNQTLAQNQALRFTTASLPEGVYFIRMISGQNIRTQKVAIMH